MSQIMPNIDKLGQDTFKDNGKDRYNIVVDNASDNARYVKINFNFISVEKYINVLAQV